MAKTKLPLPMETYTAGNITETRINTMLGNESGDLIYDIIPYPGFLQLFLDFAISFFGEVILPGA